MEEPITPENILNGYKDKHISVIEKVISSTIKIVNEDLKYHSDSIVKDGTIIIVYKDTFASLWDEVFIDRITINGKNWNFSKKSERIDFIYVTIYGVFTEWDVKLVKNKANPHFKFSPKELIDKNIKIELEAKEEAIVPGEAIENRSELLDLEK